MTRIACVLVMAVAVLSSVSAQPTGQDFLPLAVGNSWCYNYFASSTDLMVESTSSDSGTASYVIVSKSSQADSTTWQLLECREGIKSDFSFASGNFRYSTSPFKDTTAFDLVEHHSGNHRVVRADPGSFPWKSVYCLIARASDSSRFFRYLPDVGTDTIGVVAKWWYDTYQLKLTFRQGIGITRAEYSNPKITGGHSSTLHTLRSQSLVAVDPESDGGGPLSFSLHPNYPNPFNPQTNISFSIGARARVTVTIHDVLGRVIGTIFDDIAQPGTHSMVWDASGVSSGTYFCFVRTAGGLKCTKMLLVR